MVDLREAVHGLPNPIGADILESDEAYLLVVDAPGATPAHTTITTREGSVAVSVERSGDRPPEATVVREERPKSLEFELSLPEDADVEAARASLASGVLEITIPRREPGISIPVGEG